MRRAVVNDFLQATGKPEIFVIGDAAHFVQDERPLPMIAPVAIQQAAYVAKSIRNMVKGLDISEHTAFRYKDVGNMATIGRNAAVVHVGAIKIKGFWAWAFWSTSCCAMSPSSRADPTACRCRPWACSAWS